MIRSLRGLAILGVLIVLLAIAAILGGRHAAPSSHALVERLAVDQISDLQWTYPDGTVVHVVRAPAGWTWAADSTHPSDGVDGPTLDGTLSALRGGTWHRERSGSLATPDGASTRLVVTSPRGPVTLRIAPPGAADSPVPGQTWLATGRRLVLVDDWISRALAPSELALAEHTPLARIATATRLGVRTGPAGATVTLAGSPLAMREPAALRVVPAEVTALVRALADLEIIARPSTGPGAPVATTVDIDRPGTPRATARFHAACGAGPCACGPGLRLVSGTAAAGCVAASQVEAIVAAASALTADVRTLAVPSPVDFALRTVTFPDGATLTLGAVPTLDGQAAAVERVAELAVTLATPGVVITLPSGAPTPTPLLGIDGDAGEHVDLVAYPDHIVARAGEPVALQLGAGAIAILQRPAVAYRDVSVWREDPFTIHAITITRAATTTTVTRGAVIGEWTRDGTTLGPALATRADTVATQLARPEPTPAPSPGSVTPTTYRVTLDVRAPSGAATTHALALHARGGHCALVTPAATFTVAFELCDAIAALAAAEN